MSFSTPILLIIFNRPDKTRRVFEAIKKIKPTKLYIAADGPRDTKPEDREKCQKARAIINDIDWPCELKTDFLNQNIGADKRVETAINWFFDQQEEGIILEDDCVPNTDFFTFAETLLERYRNDTEVMMISGNNFQNGVMRGTDSYHFSHYPNIWGWATWRRAWQKYDSTLSDLPEFITKNKISMIRPRPKEQKYWIKFFKDLKKGRYTFWDAKWLFALWNNNSFSITPNVNLVQNIGFGKDATHTSYATDNTKIAAQNMPPIILHPSTKTTNEKADQYLFDTIYTTTLYIKIKLFLKKLYGKF